MNANRGRGSFCLNWAHRGASGHTLENTLPAFQMAIQMGADGIECDVRETKDGQMVVFHDATLKRIAHRAGVIEHLSWPQLERVHLRHGAASGPLKIPRLAGILEEIPPPFLLNLEIKKANPEKLLDLIGHSPAADRVLLSSFDPKCLIQIRALDSDIAIGYLVDRKMDAALFQEAREMQAQSLHLAVQQVTPETITRAQDEGFRVYAYTVNAARSMIRLMAMGVDGLFTNYPDRLAQLKRRTDVKTAATTRH